jgi:hypothetical protein
MMFVDQALGSRDPIIFHEMAQLIHTVFQRTQVEKNMLGNISFLVLSLLVVTEYSNKNTSKCPDDQYGRCVGVVSN